MLDESEKQAFYQEHLMTVIISALQVSGKEEFVRAALQSLLPSAATHLQDSPFKSDLLDLCKIALVSNAPVEDMPTILALRDSLKSAGSPSRFAKPLRLLSTGIELMGKVAEEQCAIAEEMVTLDLLAKLEQETKDWQPNLALPDRQPVAYDASDRQKYADAFAQLSVITSKGTNRFLSRHSARLEQQKELISQPFITLRQAMKENLAAALIEQLSLIASTLDKNSYSIENCEIVSKAFQDVLCVFPPAESFSGLAPQDITHSCVRWLEWHQTSVRVLESTAAALAQRGDIQPCEKLLATPQSVNHQDPSQLLGHGRRAGKGHVCIQHIDAACLGSEMQELTPANICPLPPIGRGACIPCRTYSSQCRRAVMFDQVDARHRVRRCLCMQPRNVDRAANSSVAF